MKILWLVFCLFNVAVWLGLAIKTSFEGSVWIYCWLAALWIFNLVLIIIRIDRDFTRF